jgi:alpha-L-fucosidase
VGISRRTFIAKSATAAAGLAAWRAAEQEAPAESSGPQQEGPFLPTWDSLAQYRCPEWFRDAKFGIWAHWTAQCVPEQGDWYARQMYEQGNPDYNYQCNHYGHPSKVGFKDIDHIWRAENWDPETLIKLYKAAGAKYFVALANHHDNFDCFDSKYQPWNSVKIGPKKDLVGAWAKVARKYGLRFGVTSHASHAWSWFEVAQGTDRDGPLAGIPYDGKLTKSDGKGQWWEGLDPQDLYAQNHRPGTSLQWEWDASKGSSVPDAAYIDKFYRRTLDLLDKYQPDLLYFDDTVLPLYPISDVGLRIAAHYYNSSIRRHGGRLEAVLNGKGLNAAQRKCMVDDFERGRSDTIVPHPWQTDTCIGDWHYRRSLYENHRYKTVDQVVKMLVDIVAKNGNLLLNIPVRGDGTIDDDEIKFLKGMAAWMMVNEEAIFATRPWTISGEGPVKVRGGGFSEGGEERLTAADFRFTTKGNVLYATAMGWPTDGRYVLRTLAAGAAGIVGDVKQVQLLGHRQNLPFQRTPEGLVVTLPTERPCEHAYVLRISGLKAPACTPQPPAAPVVRAAANGSIMLAPDAADLHGAGIKAQGGSEVNIGYWDNPQDYVSWRVHFDAPGSYSLSARIATAVGASAFAASVDGGAPVRVAVPQTGNWNVFRAVTGGPLVISSAGDHVVAIKPADPANWHPINLSMVTLTKTG